MRWLINQDLSCCEIDEHLVFLDLALDRYFRLSPPLESAMCAYLASGTLARNQREALERSGIVIAYAPECATMPDLPAPTASAIESPAMAMPRAGPSVLAEVAATVWGTRRRLRRDPFRSVIDKALTGRAPRPSGSCMTSHRALEEATLQFIRARRYVPIAPCCLLDSLALFRFLARRRLPARIVFGVTLLPFAAHCWLQAGGTILNETLSDAGAHTPVRII